MGYALLTHLGSSKGERQIKRVLFPSPNTLGSNAHLLGGSGGRSALPERNSSDAPSVFLNEIWRLALAVNGGGFCFVDTFGEQF